MLSLYKFFNNRGFGIAVLLAAVVSVATCVLIISGISGVVDYGDEKLYAKSLYPLKGFDFGITWMYILCIVAVIFAFVLEVVYMVQNFQESKRRLLIIGAGLAVFLLFVFVLGSNTYSVSTLLKMDITDTHSRIFDGSLKFLYVTFFASIISMVAFEVYNRVKNH
jgi:hypothetical protein